MKPGVAGWRSAPPSNAVAGLFQQAVQAHQEGRMLQADALCGDVLRADPQNYAAWHFRGLLALQRGDADQGMAWLERSLELCPDQPAVHANRGNAFLSQGRPREALASLDNALRLKPDYVAALFNRGNALRQLQRFGEALASYDQALSLKRDHVEALNNRGLVLLEMERAEEALASFARAVGVDPRYSAAHRNMGASLLKLHRPLEALEHYDRLLQWAPQDAAAWRGRGDALLELKRLEDALGSYQCCLEIEPDQVDALLNRGHVLQRLRQPRAALEHYERALRNAPDSVIALNNSGNALLELGQAQAALERYEQALELAPDALDTLHNRGAALRDLRQYRAAADCFSELLRAAPEHDRALASLFHLQMDYCDWTRYDSRTKQLRTVLARTRNLINPLSLLLLPESVDLPLACTHAYVSDKHPPNDSLGPLVRSGPTAPEQRIRLAYISADFRDHPVAHLLVGALEHHDRREFEVIGVSLREPDGSVAGARVRSAFERLIDVGGQSDPQVARLLRELEVDVAIDLMGLTEGMRLGIFAHRAAPVQVSYLGFACTVGASYIDYLIADGMTIPEHEESRYAERIVRLPHSFLPNDDRRAIADEIPSRAAARLPEDALVLCAFTNPYKINPPMFDVWMRLLHGAPRAVLWLRAMVGDAQENLRREANARGIAPERLIFAPHVPGMPEHLARMSLADLYLDTVPYNAHSTACDALWAGVPVLSCTGDRFAGRVAASALAAAGLPELITHSLETYERRALQLLREPGLLRELRSKLERNRRCAPLFDTALYTRHLEAAYRTMHQVAVQGHEPRSFTVESLCARA